MKSAIAASMTILLLAAVALAAPVRQRWGGDGPALAHPKTMRIVQGGGVTRLLFDLSAIPRGAKVHHASLQLPARGGQPYEPIRIHDTAAVGTDGKPTVRGAALALEPPWFGSLDATAAARRWVAEPKANLGLTLLEDNQLDVKRAVLEVLYDAPAAPAGLPEQVSGLRAVHHDGQTFLVFNELPAFRPKPSEIRYITKWSAAATETVGEPGNDEMGNPRQPAVTLATLRHLQGLKVRTTPGRSQEEPPFERVREVPHVRYRVYRGERPITPANLHEAERVGETTPLCGYDQRMVIIFSRGEYYQKHERPENIIPTYCVEDFKGLTPGEAFYCHTVRRPGRAYYAVTSMVDGTENCARLTAANSLARPLVERAGTPRPVRYFTTPSTVRARHTKSVEHWHLLWLAPPFANLPQNTPKRICVAVPEDFKAPGPMLIDTRGSLGREGGQADTLGSLSLRMEHEGGVAYNSGRGTLRSFRETRLDYYPERHLFHVIAWARRRWRVDPARISGTKGMSIHLAIRHPEVFRVFWPDRPEFYSNDFDSKWNPRGWNLARVLGPPELVRTPDGSPAWDIYNVAWYMARDPGRDIPFMGCLFSQPKDGNHGAEYGWQDDPKGWAALQQHRQPYVAQWGHQGGIDTEVRRGLWDLRWDRSVPAFSNCSLDNSPGNGDPDDGDPWGQINGYLFWEYETIVDEPGRWEMTVYLVPGCPEARCTVDLTPRHRSRFHPKAGAKFRWTNTDVATGKPLQSGTVTADRSGLVTLEALIVTKGKNRIRIEGR
jgi:hypothetical protein